jgi:hypothetical protein
MPQHQKLNTSYLRSSQRATTPDTPLQVSLRLQSRATRIFELARQAQDAPENDAVPLAISENERAMRNAGCTQADIYWRVCAAAVAAS